MFFSSIGVLCDFLSSVYISVSVLSLCLYFLANKRCHKITLYRFNQGAHIIAGGLKWEHGG